MHPITTVISLLFSCCLWKGETRKVTEVLSVSNGGRWGDWGKEEYCQKGYINGIMLKMQKTMRFIGDNIGVVGIRAHCTDGSFITSTMGKGGEWFYIKLCKRHIGRFALRVLPPQGMLGDDAAVTNVKFECEDGTVLEREGQSWGTYGKWSNACHLGAICGIQTKVDRPMWLIVLDRTELNDVKFFCCR